MKIFELRKFHWCLVSLVTMVQVINVSLWNYTGSYATEFNPKNLNISQGFETLREITICLWQDIILVAETGSSLTSYFISYQNMPSPSMFWRDITPGTPLPAVCSGIPVCYIERNTGSLHLPYQSPFSIMTVLCQRSLPAYRPVWAIFALFLYRYSV